MIFVYSYIKSENRTLKVYEWLDNHSISYVKIDHNYLTKEIVEKMLTVCDDGFNTLLIPLKKASQKGKEIYNLVDINNITTNKLIEIILEFPKLISSPVIFNEKKIVTGYKQEELRKFLSKEYRKSAIKINLGD